MRIQNNIKFFHLLYFDHTYSRSSCHALAVVHTSAWHRRQ